MTLGDGERELDTSCTRRCDRDRDVAKDVDVADAVSRDTRSLRSRRSDDGRSLSASRTRLVDVPVWSRRDEDADDGLWRCGDDFRG